MQLHELKPLHKLKQKKRVGRGGKRGTYCGKGVKGQKSRAGRKLKPVIKETLKRYPKLRGYKFKAKKRYVILNFDILEKNFKEGEKINPEILVEKRIIRKVEGKIPAVKILGKGDLKKKLEFENCFFSHKAKEKIEKAKGIIHN